MATLNSSIKVNAAISNQQDASGMTMYTAPANGYAIINISVFNTSANSAGITVDGLQMFASSGISNTYAFGTFYVGPGQSVVSQVGGTNTVNITGVEFININT